MIRVLEPMSPLVGSILLSYCLWQLTFDPVRGPIPGRWLPYVALALGAVTGLGLITWGFHRLDLLRRP